MTRTRHGLSLLEILVCLTILMVVVTTVTLSALKPNVTNMRQTIVHACSTTAIRERRTVTTELDKAFIVCRPDGRIQAGRSERPTVLP